MNNKLWISEGMEKFFAKRSEELVGGEQDVYALLLLEGLHETAEESSKPMFAFFHNRLLAAVEKIDRLKEEQRIWPKWASEIFEILCVESGFDPQSDDEIDLPELLQDHIREINGYIDSLRSLDNRDARIAERTDSEIRRLNGRISEIGKQFRSLYMAHNDLLEKTKND